MQWYCLKCRKYSDSEAACDHCGCDFDEKDKKATLKKAGRIQATILILGLGAFILLASMAFNANYNTSTTTTESQMIMLTSIVSFNGTQFIITNNDDFDWTNVILTVNFDPSSGFGGYNLKCGSIEAGSTYTIGAMQFAKRDGERFNPFRYKPQNIRIRCDTEKGRGTTMFTFE